ncbi:MAG: hypothetical protein AAFY39_08300 [Pseudomonadota bacterium]
MFHRHHTIMELAFYTTLVAGPLLLLVLHAILFAGYLTAAVWAMMRLGWARGQVVLYASWAFVVLALFIGPRPELVHDAQARISYLHQTLDARLNGQEAVVSPTGAVDWGETLFWALAMPPALYCVALLLCIVGFVMAVRWRVDGHIGRFFDELAK